MVTKLSHAQNVVIKTENNEAVRLRIFIDSLLSEKNRQENEIQSISANIQHQENRALILKENVRVYRTPKVTVTMSSYRYIVSEYNKAMETLGNLLDLLKIKQQRLQECEQKIAMCKANYDKLTLQTGIVLKFRRNNE